MNGFCCCSIPAPLCLFFHNKKHQLKHATTTAIISQWRYQAEGCLLHFKPWCPNHSVASFATNNKNPRHKLPSTVSDRWNNSTLVRSSKWIFNLMGVSTKKATCQSFLFLSLLPIRKYSNPECSRTGQHVPTTAWLLLPDHGDISELQAFSTPKWEQSV